MGSTQLVIGYGHANGDRSVTWGTNIVSLINQPIPMTNKGVNYNSNDLLTMTQNGSGNLYQIVAGDSGGPDFTYNSTAQRWELAGLNEATVAITRRETTRPWSSSIPTRRKSTPS